MSIVIPKAQRSLAYPELTVVDLNDVDVDRLLPHLWELVVRQGRVAPSKTDASAYDEHLTRLQNDPRLVGFDGPRGRQVLDGWLRASVVRIGAKGRGHAESQMDHVLPLTLASYRGGLPTVRTRHRRADLGAYRLMVEALEARGEANPARRLRDLFQVAVGHGVRISQDGQRPPAYDGITEVDVNALLSLLFLETFTSGTGGRDVRRWNSSPVPGATGRLGSDLVDYLVAYGGAMSSAAFIDRFSALLALHLFELPLRIGMSVQHLWATGEPSEDMRGGDANPLELYCDFTRVPGSASDDLAHRCVQRELDVMRGFMTDRLALRIIDEAASAMNDEYLRLVSLPVVDRFVEYARLRDHEMVRASAAMRINEIHRATSEDPANEDGLAKIEAHRRSGASPVEQLAAILRDELGVTGLRNQISWFWSTGGIQKPYGLLQGDRAARRSWCYAPSDDLLSALLLVVFTSDGGRHVHRELPIADVLADLRRRFGILIDRPPAADDTADNRAAAAANLAAFKRRLQLLGCFDGLSDDFSAQFVTRPLEAV